MSEYPRAPASVASEGSAAPGANYFSSSSTMPSGGGRGGDRNITTDAAAGVVSGGGGGRTTFAFAEILETARSSTLDDLGSLLETIAEARQQQQQQQAAAGATTEAEAAEAEEEKERRQRPLPLPHQLPRPRFVAVHPSCASHAIKAKNQRKNKRRKDDDESGDRSSRDPFFPHLHLRLLSRPQLQLLLQAAAAVGLASCFVLVDALAFRQACSAVGFALIVMLIASSSAAVGARLVSCASFLLPLALGAAGGGVAASLAREVAGVSVVERPSSVSSSPPAYFARPTEPQFTVALVGFNLFVLALASAWRVAQSPPYAFGQGLIVALSCGGVAAAAASAAALGTEVDAGTAAAAAASALVPIEESHAHWQRIVLPTLAAGGVAVAAALLASLLVLPSLASTSVERAVAVCLKGLGAALSSSSSRFFGVGEREERGEGGEDASAAAAAAAFADGRSKSKDNDDSGVENNNNNGGNGETPASLSSSSSATAAALRLRSLHALHRQETLAARPVKGAAAAALPPVMLAPRLAMRREPAESPGFEAWWDRLCAPVDAVEATSSSSSEEDDDDDESSEDDDIGVDGGENGGANLRRPLRRRRRRMNKRRQQGPDDDRPLPPQQQQQQKDLLSRRRSRLSGVSKSFARLAQSVGSLAGSSSKRRQQQRRGGAVGNGESRATEDEVEEAGDGGNVGEVRTTAAAPLPLPPSHRRRRHPPPPPPPPQPPRPTILLFDMAQAPPPASNLRPLIAAARAALSAAAAEPPLLRALPSFFRHRRLSDSRRPFNPAAWARLLLALDRLLTRISALEFAASNDDVFFGEDGEDGDGDGNGSGCASLPWKRGVVDAMRLAFAQAAAALAHLSEEAAAGGDGRRTRRLPAAAAARSLSSSLPPSVDYGKGGGDGDDDLELGTSGRRSGGGGEGRGGLAAELELERANSSALCRSSSSVGFVHSFRRTEEALHRALLEQIELHVRTVREAAAAEATAQAEASAGPAAPAETADDGGGGGRADPEKSSEQPQQPSSSPPPQRTLVLPSAYTSRSRFFAFSLALAVLRQMTEVDEAAAACFFDCCRPVNANANAASPSSPSTAAPPVGAWARSLLEVFFCAPVLRRTLDRARRVAVAAAERWRRLLRREKGKSPPQQPPPAPPFPKLGANGRRVLVAGLKYFLVISLLLAAMLSAESGSTDVARLVPSACFAAGALSMSEKVEATATKVSSWVLATVVGGAAGGVLLVVGWLPARPALLGLAVAALAGVGAAATARTGRWRTTVVLALLTTSAISLCRFDTDCRGGTTAARAETASSSSPSTLSAFGQGKYGRRGSGSNGGKWCSTAGTAELVASRAASVAVGVLVAAAVNVFVAPWFVSDWSLSALGTALRDVSEPFIEQQYARFYAEGEAAAAATAAARAAARRAKGAAGTEEEDDPYRLVAAEVAGVVARGLERLESEKGSSRKNRRGRNGGGGGQEEEKAAKREEEEEDELGAADAPPLPVVSSPATHPPLNSSVSYAFVPFLPASARPPLSLQHDIAPRIVEVQASLARDATAWSRGVLSTPPVLQSLLRSSLALLDALASLQVAVSTCSSSSTATSSSGRPLTGAAHLCFVRPVAPATAEVFASLRAAAAAAADHLDAVSSSRTAWSGLASFFSGEMGVPRKEKRERKRRKGAEEEEDDEEEDDDDDEEDDYGNGTARHHHHRHRHHHHHHRHRHHHHHHHREANAATRARLRAAIDDLRARRAVAIESQSAARRFFHVAMARHHHRSSGSSSSSRAAAAADAAAGAPGEEENAEEEEEEEDDGQFVLPSDQLRHLATMSALIKAMNRFTAVLRAAAAC